MVVVKFQERTVNISVEKNNLMPVYVDNLPRVRSAETGDIDSLVEMCRLLHGEMATVSKSHNPLPFDEDMTRSTIVHALPFGRNDQDAGPAWIGVIGDVGDVKASSYLMMQTPWYSPEPYLTQLWTFVHPEARKTADNLKELISFGCTKAQTLNVALRVGVSDGMGLERFYGHKNGFNRVGAFYEFNGGYHGGR